MCTCLFLLTENITFTYITSTGLQSVQINCYRAYLVIFFLLPVFWFLESDSEDPVQWNIHFWHSLFDLHFDSSVATCSWVYIHIYILQIWITRKHWLLWLYRIVHWEELCHRVGNHEDNLVFDIFLFLDEITWVTEWVMFSDIASTELCELVIISRGSVRLGLAHKEALLQVGQLPGIGSTHLLQMHRCFPLPRPPNLKHNCHVDSWHWS